jgi:hypothetical protein
MANPATAGVIIRRRRRARWPVAAVGDSGGHGPGVPGLRGPDVAEAVDLVQLPGHRVRA